jgi:hypothetical protein
MMTKVHVSTNSRGTFFGMPVNTAIEKMQQSARELNESLEKVSKEHEENDRRSFGERLTQAVKRKVAARAQSRSNVKAEDETFGQKLKRAVQRKVAKPAKPATRKPLPRPKQSK